MPRRKSQIKKLMSEKLPGEMRKKAKYYPTQEEMNRWFRIINKELFDNNLCYPDIMIMKPLRGRWGDYTSWPKRDGTKHGTLRLNNHFISKKHFVHTLIHELIHHYQFMVHGEQSHGKTFTEWYPKLQKFNYPPYGYNISK